MSRWARVAWGAVVLLAFVSVAAYGSPIGDAERTVLAQPAPPITASPTSFTFPRTQPFTRSAPQRLVLTNTSSSTVNFLVMASDQLPIEVTGCTVDVGPNESCNLDLVFAPIAGGPPFAQGSIRVASQQGEIQLPLTVGWLPLVSTPVPPLDLGPVRDGFTSSTGTLSIENFWPQDTSITSVSLPAGSRFAITRSTCGGPIASGGTCAVDVVYTPGVHVGADTAALTLTGPWNPDGATASEVFAITAQGVASPIISVAPTSLSFPGDIQVGTSTATQQVVVTNVGTATLNLDIEMDNDSAPEFPRSGCETQALPAGDSCTITIAFAPVFNGVFPRQTQLMIFDFQNTDVGARVPITTGRILPLDFEPRSVAFPATPVGGASAPVNIRVRNYNTATTPVAGYRLSNGEDFAVNSFNCSPGLASGAYCDIVVVFEPTKSGAIAGDLIVFGPFYGQPAQEVVPLTGTGGSAENRPPTAADDAVTVQPGGTITINPRRNDSDPDVGAVLAVPTIVTAPSIGTATVGADGTVTYVAPRRIASGTVIVIVYSVCDQQGACATAIIRITITSSRGLLPATGTGTTTFLALAAGLVLAGALARRAARPIE